MRKENRMAEVYNEAKAVIIRMMCDCGGEMIQPANTVTLTSIPPQYLHVCNKCGKQELYYKQYPCVDYIELRNPDKYPEESTVVINTESE